MELKETAIRVQEITEFNYSGGTKTGWNIIAEGGGKYVCFSSTEMKKVVPGTEIKLRYTTTEKNGYTNYNITQIANEAGEFEAKTSSSAGGRTAKADPDKLKQDKDLEIARNKSIQRQVAAKEATQIGLAYEKAYSDTFWVVWNEAYNHILETLLEVK